MSLKRFISSVMAMVMIMSCFVIVNGVSVSAADESVSDESVSVSDESVSASDVESYSIFDDILGERIDITENVFTFEKDLSGVIDYDSLDDATKALLDAPENNLVRLVGSLEKDEITSTTFWGTEYNDVYSVGFVVIPARLFLGQQIFTEIFGNGESSFVTTLISWVVNAASDNSDVVIISEGEALYDAIYDAENVDANGNYVALDETELNDGIYYMLSFADLEDNGGFSIGSVNVSVPKLYFVFPYTVTGTTILPTGIHFDDVVENFSLTSLSDYENLFSDYLITVY